MSVRFENFCLILTVLGATVCLSPLLSLSTQNVGDGVEMYGDPAPNLFYFVIIPAVDLLLDCMTNCVSYFCSKSKNSSRQVGTSGVCRLTDAERLLFIFGIAIQAIASSNPNQEVLSDAFIVENSINNCSVFLTVCPIIIYLTRCTTTFTCLRTVFILSSGLIGIIFYTATYYCRSIQNSGNYGKLSLIGNVFVSASGVVFVATIFLSFISYVDEKLKCPIARQKFQRLFSSPKIGDGIPEDDCLKIDTDRELYSNYIPALHIVSLVLIIVANIYSKYATWKDSATATRSRGYITLAAEIIVLIVELRIRKNAVVRGLVSLLESKKSYVRYISHELRTPLNTAFLGLKLLTGEMKASKDPRDIERSDTLCDVNISCMAAVDILNDLLCYEKLESGILQLHKENIIVGSLLNDSVAMFSAQAREGGVTMTVVTDAGMDISTDMTAPMSLQAHDSVFVDKFKMNQVIRNLISNALKFTPRGGSINITAKFVASVGSLDDLTVSSLGASQSVRSNSLTGVIGNSCWNGCRETTITLPKSINVIDPDTDPVDGYLVLVVTDTGAGISMENQKRLFKEIVQFSPEKLQAGGGSGLGLWISGGIVDLHDGKISVHSEGEGMGSSFTVEIPMLRLPLRMHTQQCEGCTDSSDLIHDVQTAESTVDRKPSQPLRRKPSLKPISPSHFASSTHPISEPEIVEFDLLVVDDSRLNRKVLMKLLMSNGHRCTEAEDGFEAIERVKERIGGRSEHFDFILMDFGMPNMDGPTATRQLRTMGYNGAIIGVTGNGLPSDIEMFLNCGANKVLLKPLDLDALGQAMKDMMT